MSGNGYGYYYPPNAQHYPVDPNQGWSEWSMEQQQFNARNLHGNTYINPRPPNYYNATNRHYTPPRRFNSPNQGGPPIPPPNWPRNNFNKRPRQDMGPDESKNKTSKKKKKPLSQNMPKKDWTLEDAQEALTTEKEFNKRYKNHSLIIKFPDVELNRDIVSKYHEAIENVHFQQPSTPRFCFVTLQETADTEAVISHLNTIKFGEGYLSAEYKKDREDDQNFGPEDIDPCTLYVGNLGQEVTKDEVVKLFPKGRRIDIGFAKKMKYTRYAFVSFKTVTDSIEAFKRTHNTQLYSKSLIVRFRRLHGTVGMPGESKLPPKKAETPTTTEPSSEGTEPTAGLMEPPMGIPEASPEFDLSVVKQEVNSSDDENDYESPFMPGSLNTAFEQHRPMIKQEIKTEPGEEDSISGIRPKAEPSVIVKAEPDSSDDDELGSVNFDYLLNKLVDQSRKHEKVLQSLK